MGPLSFVISLDFELMWGVRDHADKKRYGRNVLGAREAIPRILDLFERYAIRATWAAVGFLFCENKDHLMASMPSELPRYRDKKLSNYAYLDELGYSEADDPYYYGSSLIRRIAQAPGQEIGSHSFSHYYCLEPGQTLAQFEADIDAALAVAKQSSIELRSFVFPRNQYAPEHLAVLRRRGFTAFRGNERSWVYRPSDGAGQSKLRRAVRLADHYANLTGHHVYAAGTREGLTEVTSSRFLRPYSARLAPLEPMRITRIKSSMDVAAANGGIYHLWWHPHNFGLDIDENVAVLRQVLDHFARHRERAGMTSRNIGDFA